MEIPNANKRGRPKGSPNKVGKAAKDVIAQAAAELGGAKPPITKACNLIASSW